MARNATGIDIGTSTAKLLQGEVKGNSFVVTHFAVAENPKGTIADGWQALSGSKPTRARIGLTGRDVNMRYSRVPRLPDWQLRKLMRFEAEEIGGQSESQLASDFNVLPEIPEIEGEDMVLLSMARESLLEEHSAGLSQAGGKLDAFTPNAIALYNAFLHYGVVMDDTVLVANIGADNLDTILVRGTDLLFARNMSGGSKLFDEALVQRFEIAPARAERYKIEEGTLDPSKAKDANQEKAARAMAAPAGQLLSLLQSAVLFAKSQVKLSTLKLDRVLLCGGGAALPGLLPYLSKAMGVPVELFDPFIVVDTTKLDPASAEQLEDHRLEAVVALGLATSASDPEAYSIEIMPAAVRKRREFMNGPAFLIAAAALAALYLGFFGMKKRAELSELEAQAGQLSSQFRRADSQHRQTQGLLEENERLAALSQELFALSGAGEQLVRSLDVLERELPEDFWLESMTMGLGSDEDLGVSRADEKPLLRLRGRAREGTDSATVLWEGFVASLRDGLPEARIKERMGESTFTLDLTALAPPDPEDDPDGDASDGTQGSPSEEEQG